MDFWAACCLKCMDFSTLMYQIYFCHLINENTVIRLFLSSAVIKKQYERFCWIFCLSRLMI